MGKRGKITVIGMTRFGRELALRLTREGAEVTVLDIDPGQVQPMMDQVSRAVTVDARDQKSLIELGVHHSDLAVIGIRNSLEMSVLILLALKEIGVRQVIALASGDDAVKVLEKMGADKILFPERDIARREAELILHPGLTGYTDLADGYNMFETAPPPSWLGQTLLELNVRRRFGVNIIAVRQGGTLGGRLVMPGPDYMIKQEDQLLVIGPEAKMHALAKMAPSPRLVGS